MTNKRIVKTFRWSGDRGVPDSAIQRWLDENPQLKIISHSSSFVPNSFWNGLGSSTVIIITEKTDSSPSSVGSLIKEKL
ncbi:hypothetical protein LCGC14_1457940 [marine sediment metagenome]|uniref:Uncharacterized protein n=1 Tax=marine sediment metagenome TaxID=412755 RepID=A0A0F9K227_9ZZZZ